MSFGNHSHENHAVCIYVVKNSVSTKVQCIHLFGRLTYHWLCCITWKFFFSARGPPNPQCADPGGNLGSDRTRTQKTTLDLHCKKNARPLRAALDRERFLITDKQTESFGCIPCVMVIFLSTRQAKPIY